ncbi:hypothetical protein MRB53_037654 [Persea americana]|nr:hypothetical protein MRB53_037654 [Persea americana]
MAEAALPKTCISCTRAIVTPATCPRFELYTHICCGRDISLVFTLFSRAFSAPPSAAVLAPILGLPHNIHITTSTMEKHLHTTAIDLDDAPHIEPAMAGTVQDHSDMTRIGRVQRFRRNFHFLHTLGLICVLMITWEGVLFTNSYNLPRRRPRRLGMGIPRRSDRHGPCCPFHGGDGINLAQLRGTSMLGSGNISIRGWLCVLGWQANFASVMYLCGESTLSLAIQTNPDLHPEKWHGTLVVIGYAALSALFHLTLGQHLPKVELGMLLLHILGFIAVLATLWSLGPKAPCVLRLHDIQQRRRLGRRLAAQPSSAPRAPSFALIGADSAVHLAEEVHGRKPHHPSRHGRQRALQRRHGVCDGRHGGVLHHGPAGITRSRDADFDRRLNGHGKQRGSGNKEGAGTEKKKEKGSTTVQSPSSTSPQNSPSPPDATNDPQRSHGHVQNASYGLPHRRWSLGPLGAAINITALAFIAPLWIAAFFPLSSDVDAGTLKWAVVIYVAVVAFAVVYYWGWARGVDSSPRPGHLRESLGRDDRRTRLLIQHHGHASSMIVTTIAGPASVTAAAASGQPFAILLVGSILRMQVYAVGRFS